jgi:hypothetical protein
MPRVAWGTVNQTLSSASGDIQLAIAHWESSESVIMHGYHQGGPSEYDEGSAATVCMGTAAGKVSAMAGYLSSMGDPGNGGQLGVAFLKQTAADLNGYGACGEGLPVAELQNVAELGGQVAGMAAQAQALADTPQPPVDVTPPPYAPDPALIG